MRVTTARTLTAAAAMTLLFTTAACGGGSDSNSGTDAASVKVDQKQVAGYATPPTALPVTQQVSKPIPTGKTIAFISSGIPVSKMTLNGLEAAAQVLGWTVRESTFDVTNPATINTAIESAIAEKPDAIVLSALETAQYQTLIPKAREAGIPLIPYAVADKPQDGVYPVANTAVRSVYAAKILGETLVAEAAAKGDSAHVVQLTVSAFKSVLGYQDDGMKDTVTKACPKCTVDFLDIKLADVFNGQYTQQVVSYLQRHPDVKYVVSGSSELGNGLDAALKQAGLTDVHLDGFSPLRSQIEALNQGVEGAWVAQPYTVTGWIVADQIVRVLIGDPTDLWANEHLSYVITKDNVDGVNPAGPEFPADYESQFKALWKKQ